MNINKFSLVAALALGGLLVCTNLSSAQEAKEGKKKGGFSTQQRIEQMDKELKLTADQKTKLTALFDDQAKKMREMRASGSVTQEQRRTFREENDKKLKTILTTEQWEKWQKAREQMRPQNREKKEGKKAA